MMIDVMHYGKGGGVYELDGDGVQGINARRCRAYRHDAEVVQ